MLPVCFGEATKVSGLMLSARKAYRVVARLGMATDTGDAEGRPVEAGPVPVLEARDIDAVLGQFFGPQRQVPPMYSALKHEGRRLYELARSGHTVERPARGIEIFELVRRGWAPPDLTLETVCSKGTYVRVLVEDVARALGTVGHVEALRRLWVDPFAESEMVPIDELEALAGDRAALDARLLPMDRALPDLPSAGLSAASAAELGRGQRVRAERPPAAAVGDKVRVYGPDGGFLGLAEVTADGLLQPRRLVRLGGGA
jgi:tRNA pseudouridine55 synthase